MRANSFPILAGFAAAMLAFCALAQDAAKPDVPASGPSALG